VGRADTAGGTHEFLTSLTAPGRRLAYSAGFTITEDIQDAILKIPAGAWTPAYDEDGEVRDGAWVAEITGMLNLDGWPAGMRVIVRKERPALLVCRRRCATRRRTKSGQSFECLGSSQA
jgi:hypothetical protein